MGLKSRLNTCSKIGGIKKLYLMRFEKYRRSQANVLNNFISVFPYSAIYELDFFNGSFDETVSIEDGGEEVKQKLSFSLLEVNSDDDIMSLAKQDLRFIIETNEGKLRMIGFKTGLKGGYSSKEGVSRVDLKGYELSFETSEEIHAPYLTDLTGFDINGLLSLEQLLEIEL